ncbi:MAG: phosphoribosylglycinamide formyltransferase [Planctomycetes bacterium]|nr:phosphoribosylglycinamide formyltransferase [Planctomycetota bacterium]MBI3833543.1 phosphoribosylglycinamide formyltransferase [Planctomycetota bacterium]
MTTQKSISPLRLAVLISGGGRTLLNLQERIRSGLLNAKIVQVISSRADVAGVERSRAVHLPTVVIERKLLSYTQFQEQITQHVFGADLICMAGFLSLWRIPEAFSGRVINIHPALLPEFGGHGMYGLRVHRAVLAAGRKESGCTVHFCDNEYDHGSIILQRRVPVLDDDTPERLADRVFEQECIAYPEAIEWFASGQIELPAR